MIRLAVVARELLEIKAGNPQKRKRACAGTSALRNRATYRGRWRAITPSMRVR
jgi:hypothetical protein